MGIFVHLVYIPLYPIGLHHEIDIFWGYNGIQFIYSSYPVCHHFSIRSTLQFLSHLILPKTSPLQMVIPMKQVWTYKNHCILTVTSPPIILAIPLLPNGPKTSTTTTIGSTGRCSAARCRLETPDGHALSPPMPVHGYVAAGGTGVAAVPVATMAAPAAVPVMAAAPGETGVGPHLSLKPIWNST